MLDRRCVHGTHRISNPARPWHIYNEWIRRVMLEFFAQGDIENQLGSPISPFCDRCRAHTHAPPPMADPATAHASAPTVATFDAPEVSKLPALPGERNHNAHSHGHENKSTGTMVDDAANKANGTDADCTHVGSKSAAPPQELGTMYTPSPPSSNATRQNNETAAKCQAGFVNFIVFPLFSAMATLLPEVAGPTKMITANLDKVGATDAEGKKTYQLRMDMPSGVVVPSLQSLKLQHLLPPCKSRSTSPDNSP